MDSETSNRHKIILVASDARKQQFQEFLQLLNQYYQLIELKNLSPYILDFPHSTILILGGDGSFNYLINKLTPIQLAQTPTIMSFCCGTANDFARSLKLSVVEPDFGKFVAILHHGMKVKIPLMQCNDHFFINAMSAGTPAKITSSGEKLGKKILGRFNYFIEAFDQLLNKESYQIELVQPDQTALRLQTLGFMVAQGMYAGGGVKISSGFVPYFQQSFEFLTLMANQLGPTVKATLEIQKTDPQLEGLPLLSRIGEQMQLTCDRTMPAKLDGEEYSASSFLFKKSIYSVNIHLH